MELRQAKKCSGVFCSIRLVTEKANMGGPYEQKKNNFSASSADHGHDPVAISKSQGRSNNRLE
ncbi:MAG: hypothetical protein IJL98_01600 [Lachnospiraceae bacterium]|nr:hypothetical protein [Lachnospiraceae bacterium]